MLNKYKPGPEKYFNPYFGGVLLSLLLLATIYLTKRGLGASGAVKNVVAASVNEVAPEHVANNAYYAKFAGEEKHPLSNWLIFEVIGVLLGAFISGSMAGRLKFSVERPKKIKRNTRLIFAVAGGILFGIGSQFARGCTSGAALSGSATMSAAGVFTMMLIFGGGYAFAYFFRKLWI